MSDSNTYFDTSVQAIINGDEDALRSLLEDDPDLIRARSSSPHRCTLLHYIGANGIEGELQKTPPNAVEITRILLDAGAEVDALAETYGGGPNQTTLLLLVTSSHPARAGLQAELVDTLCKAGAAVNGVDGSGGPLSAALDFMYPPPGFFAHQVQAARESIATLARHGAEVNNIFAAVVLGQIEYVEDHFNKPENADNPKERLIAFLFACMSGHIEIAGFLLEKGVDINALYAQNQTGLHLAAGCNHQALVAFLIDHGADLNARDAQDQTPLAWAEEYEFAVIANLLREHGAS